VSATTGVPRTESVPTSAGPVRGFVADGMRQFLGIRYGAPPVGELRWRPPEPPTPWVEPYDAIQFGPSAPQTVTLAGYAAPSTSEDCLFLNVFAPAEPADGPRPVMVWFPGGGMFSGQADPYDPAWLVDDGGVVFVSLNYRLNVFGFFAHPAVDAEGHLGGNYGILDQQLALAWVRDNIEHFGGDPGCVTIFGESAGATSVDAHLVSPRSAGLFHRAVIESGGSWSRPMIDRAGAQQVGMELTRALGCDQDAASLRAVPVEQILSANHPGPGWSPFVGGRYSLLLIDDGEVIPQTTREAFTRGEFHHVPVIRGTNRDEGTWILGVEELTTGRPLTEADYEERLRDMLGDRADEVMQVYPCGAHATPTNALGVALGDWQFVSGDRECVTAMSRYTSVYPYLFDVPEAEIATADVSFPWGSPHTAELHYLFRNYRGAAGRDLAPLDGPHAALAASMVRAWTTFAARGVPMLEGLPGDAWPPYDAHVDELVRFRLGGPELFGGVREQHRCDLWDDVRRVTLGKVS
jgi:para-nitrobenzyl esterase